MRDDTHVDKENRRPPVTVVIHARFCHRAVTVAGGGKFDNKYILLKNARLEALISRSIF